MFRVPLIVAVVATSPGCGRLGFSPHGVATDAEVDVAGADAALPSGPALRVYVTCGGAPGAVRLYEVDEQLHRLVDRQTIAAHDGPETLLITPAGDWLYTANLTSSNISMFEIDTATGLLQARGAAACDPGTAPKGLGLAADGKALFVASRSMTAPAIDVMTRDPVTGQLVAAGASAVDASSYVRDVGVLGGGRTLVSANWTVPTLTQFEIAADGSLGAPASIPTCMGPVSVKADPSGTHLYVGCEYEGAIGLHAIAAGGKTGPLVSTVPGPSATVGFAVLPTGASLYAIGFGSNDVVRYRVDPTDGGLQRAETLPTGMAPGAIAIDPLGRYVAISHFTTRDVALFAIADGRLTEVDRVISCATESATGVAVVRGP